LRSEYKIMRGIKIPSEKGNLDLRKVGEPE
jgi:hypothetical protein